MLVASFEALEEVSQVSALEGARLTYAVFLETCGAPRQTPVTLKIHAEDLGSIPVDEANLAPLLAHSPRHLPSIVEIGLVIATQKDGLPTDGLL